MKPLYHNKNKLIRRAYLITVSIILLPVIVVEGSYLGIKEVFGETLGSVKKFW